MNFLKVISQLNLSAEELSNLDESGLIRLEKKLLAEAAFEGNVDRDQIANTVDVIRKHGPALEQLFSPTFRMLCNLLQTDKIMPIPAPRNRVSYEEEEGLEDLRELLERLFESELSAYVMRCMQKDHYRGLSTLVYYEPLIPLNVKDQLIDLLNKKLEFGTEVIYISSRPQQKAQAMGNPFLFRVLAKIGAAYFNENVNELLNTTYSNERRGRFAYQVYFAMGFFKTSDQRLYRVLKNNREVARGKGVVESTLTFDERGGTHFKGQRRPIERKSNRHTPAGFRLVPLMVTASVLGVIFYYFLGPVGKPDFLGPLSSNVSDDKDDMGYYTELDKNPAVQESAAAFLQHINDLHSPENKVLSSQEIPFRFGLSEYIKPDPKSKIDFMGSYIIQNNTFDKTISYVELTDGTRGVIFLRQNASEYYQEKVKRVVVYSGEVLEQVTLLTPEKDTICGTRFQDFTVRRQELLKTSFSQKLIYQKETPHFILLKKDRIESDFK